MTSTSLWQLVACLALQGKYSHATQCSSPQKLSSCLSIPNPGYQQTAEQGVYEPARADLQPVGIGMSPV